MRRLLLPLLAALALPIAPMLSHGNSGNCLDECNDYYCPPEHQLEKKEKEKVKNNIPSKK
ncbi:Hypothetical protein P9515_12231 [Prochlorococcus marinus str. MIT 9515]|uniref:Uncharacterized protein n=1 Tax=Prochlorococcus marinus (strain MIT 9515) TaxID=167542 RepID=A2BXB9_PROM5|nr:hypothetical protein [Prochlorococcus marinus]ABM72430.1 Hypothetical protein P9515_12231 [Prochlorococcus marinus str. MIT 9515]